MTDRPNWQLNWVLTTADQPLKHTTNLSALNKLFILIEKVVCHKLISKFRTLLKYFHISIYSESIKKYHQYTSQKHFKIDTKISLGFTATLFLCFSQKGSPTSLGHFGSLTCVLLGCAQAIEPLEVLPLYGASPLKKAHPAVYLHTCGSGSIFSSSVSSSQLLTHFY